MTLLITGIVCFVCVLAVVDGQERNLKPYFNSDRNPLALSIHENTAVGFDIADISKLSMDDEGDTLRYDLEAVGKEICSIGARDGKLKLKTSPDREKKSKYDFNILVSDDFEGGINRASKLKVFIFISDENDNKPIFIETPYHAELLENVKIGTEVLIVKATDKDAGRNKRIRFLFAEEQKKFNLDPNSGVITVAGEIDYEQMHSYTLVVIAKDEGSPGLTEQTTVVINIRDVGDMKPYFVLHSYAKDIKENTPIGTSIAIVSAKDGDRSINNAINYVITAGDEYGLFYINKVTGNISVKGDLDREYYKEFNLRIKAYEVAKNRSYATIDLKIKLVDVNDNKPTFERSKYLVKINEEKAHSKTIISEEIKAHDDDATWENNFLQYSMTGNNVYFDVLPRSGKLILKKDLFDTQKNIYNFLVYATEQKTKEHYQTSTSVTVQVIRSPRLRPTAKLAKNISSNSVINTCNALLLLFSCLYVGFTI